MLVRKASSLSGNSLETYYDADGGDAVEAHEWRCVRTVNGTFTTWLEFFFCTPVGDIILNLTSGNHPTHEQR